MNMMMAIRMIVENTGFRLESSVKTTQTMDPKKQNVLKVHLLCIRERRVRALPLELPAFLSSNC